jgi:hypothetical protein
MARDCGTRAPPLFFAVVEVAPQALGAMRRQVPLATAGANICFRLAIRRAADVSRLVAIPTGLAALVCVVAIEAAIITPDFLENPPPGVAGAELYLVE